MKKFNSYKEWYIEYEMDLYVLFNKTMNVLKTKKLLYKEYSFDSFCQLIYKKSSKY